MYIFHVIFIVGHDSEGVILDTFITQADTVAEAIQDFIWSQMCDESVVYSVQRMEA